MNTYRTLAVVLTSSIASVPADTRCRSTKREKYIS